MWKLTSADLLQLKEGGGEHFAHFMDRLIRAEAACGGLAQAEIATQRRVNIKDGGVDTEVGKPIPQDEAGWFAVATCWQFKAVKASDIDDKIKKTKKNELQAEINKPYVKELIKKGYGYRFCLLGDLTPPKLRKWEDQLKQEALAIDPQAQAPRVVHGGHLRQWAERFPALVAQLRGWTQGGFHWEAWKSNCRTVTPTYVPNSAWESVREQILQHTNLTEASIGGEACLAIGGAAGVGKTRLAFETLNERPDAPGLVLYLADEQEAKSAATAVANTPGQTAILVADECSPETRHFLNENLRGHTKRIRMICLDNTGERIASARGQIWLKADSLTNTEDVLARNFPDVPEDRRRQYAQFSKGFVRFAADMCEHDLELAAGEMAGLLRTVEDYVRNRLRRLGPDFLPIVSLLALFNKVGSRENVIGELDALCAMTKYQRQQFYDVVRRARESPGFVVQAGRYWYVTPDIVARVLFAEGWSKWVGPNLGGFFESLPPEFVQQLLDRAATHGTEEVRSQVAAYFRGWFTRLNPSDLANTEATTLAATLVETSPTEYLPLLRTLIEGAQPGELQNIAGYALGAKWGPRRTLVWLLERLVSFPEFFEDCEACLFRLALEESEPQIGNNATVIWANLFSAYLSGTATPFPQRLPILERRTASPVLAEARLGFEAVSHALRRPEGRLLGEPVVAGRLRPDDWKPPSVNVEKACLSAALAICGMHLSSGFGEHHSLAFHVISRCLYYLIQRGLFEELRRTLTLDSLTDEEARKLLHEIQNVLAHQHPSVQAQPESDYARYLKTVREWSNQFRPNSFSGRLRDACSLSLWERRFILEGRTEVDNEFSELGTAIVEQPSLLLTELDWLATAEARSAELLGFAVGKIDAAGDCGRMIFHHAISHKAAPMLRGYIRGMVFAQRIPSTEFLDLMTKLESVHPHLAVDMLVHAGDDFDALNRIVRLVDSQAVSAGYLANLAMGLGRRRLTSDEVNAVIPYFTRAAAIGEDGTVLAGVRFLGAYLLLESNDSDPSILNSVPTRSLAWQLVESALPFLNGQALFEWGEIIKRLSVYDADRAAQVFGQALLGENMLVRDEAKRQLGQLANINPEPVMESFGSALLDSGRGWLLQVAVCRDLLGQIPPEVVLAWVRKNGLKAARTVARHLPPPGLDQTGNPIVDPVVDAILRDYDDDEVFRNFLGGVHSGEVWWGNGEEQFRRAAEDAKRFLAHPNRRIREWARIEIDDRLHLAELEDQEHEERFLPS